MRFYQGVELRVKSLLAMGRHVIIVGELLLTFLKCISAASSERWSAGDVNCSASELDHCEPGKMVWTDEETGKMYAS